MYRVLLADDEPIIRNTLRKLLSDSELPVEVVCEARNGDEAISLLASCHPDIVLTDMRMPQADGIKLLDHIYSNCSSVKTLVISGFSDFEYMKKAISCNAVEYLLKPVTPEELNTALSRAIADIERDREFRENRAASEKSLSLKRELFFQSLAYGRITKQEDIYRHAVEAGVSDITEESAVLVLAFRELHEISSAKFEGNTNLLVYGIENILNEVLCDIPGTHLFKTDEKTGVCIILPVKHLEKAGVDSLLQNINASVYSCLKLNLIGGLSLPFKGLPSFYPVFTQAVNALYENPLNTHYSFRVYPPARQTRESRVPVEQSLRVLSQAVKAGNNTEVRSSMMKLLEIVKLDAGMRLREAHKLCLDFLTVLAAPVDMGNISNILSYDQLESYLVSVVENTPGLSGDGKSASARELMKEVEQYLKSNYHEDISLVDTASRYHFEPTYFSKLFKTAMGRSFIEYLIALRMEKACELLTHTDLKVNDISMLVGYDNQQYFSQVFKKFTGFTPSGYRERL